MKQPAIQVTDLDARRLGSVVEGSRATDHRDAACAERLESHLEDAEVVPASVVGPDVVTMNSRVEVADLDSGDTVTFTLVFPRHANVAEGRVSVLAPLGMAVLGRRPGDEFTWDFPAGERRLVVRRVLDQPEQGEDVA
ncbi:MAG TPA: nucleoside diphosphate kinase regulator [Vicinamibacteria bacterium]|nr:nucleoside diphosphate kinase regulator [Vicinamibacteria bacterium]